MARWSRVKEAPSVFRQQTHDQDHEDRLSAQVVAKAFVEQYYTILYRYPNRMHNFYKDQSILSRPAADGSMRSVTTKKGIQDEIMGSDIKNWAVNVHSVDSQDSIGESVIVGVTGFLSKDNVARHFSQTFLLAPQTVGFYVHNDLFQFIDKSDMSIPHEDCQILMTDKGTSTDSSDTKNSALPDEPNKINAPPVAQPVSNTQEDAKRVSYAFIVAKASSNATFQALPNTDKPKNATGTTKEAAHKVLERKQNDQSSSSSTKESPSTKSDQVEMNSPANAQDQADNKESYASIVTKTISLPIPPQASQQVLAHNPSTTPESPFLPVPRYVKMVLIKDLPPHVKRGLLCEAVQIFGPAKHRNIQIRSHGDGYRYAFVEFNQPKSARLAIEAGSIKFDNWECPIESKKSKEDWEAHGDHRRGDDNGGGDNSQILSL